MTNYLRNTIHHNAFLERTHFRQNEGAFVVLGPRDESGSQTRSHKMCLTLPGTRLHGAFKVIVIPIHVHTAFLKPFIYRFDSMPRFTNTLQWLQLQPRSDLATQWLLSSRSTANNIKMWILLYYYTDYILRIILDNPYKIKFHFC